MWIAQNFNTFGDLKNKSAMWKVKSQCLSIHNIEIKAPLGVYEFEKEDKNSFLVSVDIWGDFSSSMHSDNLIDTLDYQLIFDIAHSVLENGGDLIEHSCKLISDRISSIDFPMTKIRVYIQKLAPPLKGKVSDTSFELILEN